MRSLAACWIALLQLLQTPAAHADQIWDGGGADAFWNTAANWGSDALPAFTNAITFGGVLQTSTSNNLTADSVIGGINFTNDGASGKTGAFSLAGNRFALDGNIVLTAVTSGSIGDTITADIVLNATRIIQTAGSHSLIISSVISDGGNGFGLLKQGGSGTVLTLSGLNTFGGTVTLVSGTLSINTLANAGSASSLGTGTTNPAILLGNSAGSGVILLYTGSGSSTNRQLQIGSGTASSTIAGTIQNDGTGALTFSNTQFNTLQTNATGARTLTLAGNNNGSNTISGIIADNNTAGGGRVALTKDGSGTWVLAGLNTFTGQVKIDQGTLSVNTLANSGVASALGTGAANALINIGSGSSTGTLIYTGSANTSTDRQVQIGRSSSNSGGATIQNDGSGTLTFSNTVFNSSDTIVTSTSATRTLSLQGSNAGGNTIFGIISNNVGSAAAAVSVTKAGAGSWTLAGANTFSGGVSLSAGTLNLNNAGSGGTSSALGTGTFTISGGTIDNTSGGSLTLSTNNAVIISGSFVFGGTQSLNLGSGAVSIGASRTITLNNARTLSLGQLQWSSDSSQTLTVTQGSGSGGKLVLAGFQLNTLGSATAARTRTIAGTANVEISGSIVDSNSFANNLAYSGSGTLTLSTTNSYGGTTTVSGGGVLDVGDLSSGALVNGGLILSNGSVLQGYGTFTRTLSSASTAATGELSAANSGFAARGGTLTVNLGGNATPSTITLTSGSFRFGNIVFGSATANSAVIVLNPLSTNGSFARTITVNSGVGGDYAELRGAITSTGSIVKAGAGLLMLSATNTYSGGTTVNAGSLIVTNTSGSATGTGAVTTSAGTILGGSGIIAPTGTNGVGIGGSVAPGVSGTNSGVGTLTFTPVDGNVAFQNGSSVAFELQADGSNDKIVFSASGSGVLDFTAMTAGSLGVTFVGGYTPVASDSFDLLDWSAVSGTGISGLNVGLLSLDSAWIWDTTQFTTSGVVSVIALAPEPTRGLLLASGMVAFVLRRRR